MLEVAFKALQQQFASKKFMTTNHTVFCPRKYSLPKEHAFALVDRLPIYVIGDYPTTTHVLKSQPSAYSHIQAFVVTPESLPLLQENLELVETLAICAFNQTEDEELRLKYKQTIKEFKSRYGSLICNESAATLQEIILYTLPIMTHVNQRPRKKIDIRITNINSTVTAHFTRYGQTDSITLDRNNSDDYKRFLIQVLTKYMIQDKEEILRDYKHMISNFTQRQLPDLSSTGMFSCPSYYLPNSESVFEEVNEFSEKAHGLLKQLEDLIEEFVNKE